MLALLAAWRAGGDPIVHVRHLSRTSASVFFPGQRGAMFQAPFTPQDAEHVVEKMCRTRSSSPGWSAGCMCAASATC
jgi:nicotinamidase-related amidase